MEKTKIKLRWLGTAGFYIIYKNCEILLDPFISRPKGANPKFLFNIDDFSNVSLIFVSHGHFDHSMDVDKIAKISNAKIYAPLKIINILEKKGINKDRLNANDQNEFIKLSDDIIIKIIPSRHITFDIELIIKTLMNVFKGKIFFDLLSLIITYPMGSNSDLLMDFEGYKIFFSGSGGGDWQNVVDIKPDCIMIPFAGRTDILDFYFKRLKIFCPKKVIIHHFDDFFPNFSIEYPVDELKTKFQYEFKESELIIPDNVSILEI